MTFTAYNKRKYKGFVEVSEMKGFVLAYCFIYNRVLLNCNLPYALFNLPHTPRRIPAVDTAIAICYTYLSYQCFFIGMCTYLLAAKWSIIQGVDLFSNAFHC